MLIIDGSYHEGGGQIIRTAVAFSALTGKAVRIENIRAGRQNPGIQAQHLAAVNAVAKLCNARVKGASMGSLALEFSPNPIQGGSFSIDIGTAGSIPLVFQAIVLPALHARENVIFEITGGTSVLWSPTINYFQDIFCYFLKKMGVDINVGLASYGFYPKGGGIVKAIITPCANLKPLNLTKRGSLDKINFLSVASESLKGAKVAERQIEGAKNILKEYHGKTEISYCNTPSPGSFIYLDANYENCKLGASAIGELYKPAEKVGEEAANRLDKQMESDACLDEWMADQIVPYLALSGGSVKVEEITPHVETNIWVVERFLGKIFEVDKAKKIIRVNKS
ncbi:MAG: RNA 3'-terminal phosphate cyclase [Nanoarchaeota archaeon]|nr:RNA 3'-terminal phosphate cyclase [Nanoarchaeota archaeon]MBU4299924.1 RNA 3'-terminal phosphate cyclase [Nanoarchaeota archaeon]MBU4451372.1 RNA 3'-terminal phosphate cyclase [Nanoarchaeota archaeon]MCG2724579.1 RNA 3'-terminal phosphate cyclase [archaeon]